MESPRPAPSQSHCIVVKWPLPLSEFHFFSKLPSELRRYIWKVALPAPRVVTFADNLFRQPANRKGLCYRTLLSEFNGNEMQPFNFLLACKEAHQVFLESYCRLRLRADGKPIGLARNIRGEVLGQRSGMQPLRAPYGYFDKKRDTILITSYLSMASFYNSPINYDFVGLEQIALQAEQFFSNEAIGFIGQLSGLKELIVILGRRKYQDLYLSRPFVPHLIDISNNTLSVLSQRSSQLRNRSGLERMYDVSDLGGAEVRDCVEGMSRVTKVFNDRVSKNLQGFKDGTLTVCVLGLISLSAQDITPSGNRPTYLVPREPRFFGASFIASNPIDGNPNGDITYRTFVDFLKCDFYCREDGTLLNMEPEDVRIVEQGKLVIKRKARARG